MYLTYINPLSVLTTLEIYLEHFETSSLWWPRYCTHYKYNRTLSVVVTLLLYAYHLYQPPVCANNATIIFRMLRCIQSLMVTLLHTEHV